tara:strand:- start:457 stop:1230 length:774 start_codon:yes stop_codon:yes gene_type:complete
MINVILFHILFLSLLEIIFYFEYIGPLETEIFKDTFKNLIKHYTNEYEEYENNYENTYGGDFILISKNNPEFNITIGNNNFTNNEDEIKKAKKDREENNEELYNKSMEYWFIFLSFVLLIVLSKVCYDYYIFKKNKSMNRIDSNNSIELRNMDSMLLKNSQSNYSINISNQISQNNQDIIIEEDNFINYNKVKKVLLKKSIFYFVLGGLILLFEYLFFNNIVLKYKVLSNEEIMSMLYGSIDKLILNFINYNKKINN